MAGVKVPCALLGRGLVGEHTAVRACSAWKPTNWKQSFTPAPGAGKGGRQERDQPHGLAGKQVN